MMRAVEAHSCRRHSPAGQCGAPFFCALDALAINDRSARAGVPPRQLPACHIERVVNAPERAVVVPSVEGVVQGAARRQVLGDRGPLAARAQDIHEAVDHLAQVDPPLVAAALGGRDQWGNQRPFLVAHVTWVAQLAPVVATTVLTRPHQRLPPDRTAAKGITTNSKHSRCSRMDTQIAKGDLAFGVGLMVLLMVVTVGYLPIVLPLLLPGVSVDPAKIACSLFLLMLLPLAGALAVTEYFAAVAAHEASARSAVQPRPHCAGVADHRGKRKQRPGRIRNRRHLGRSPLYCDRLCHWVVARRTGLEYSAGPGARHRAT